MFRKVGLAVIQIPYRLDVPGSRGRREANAGETNAVVGRNKNIFVIF